MLYVDDLNLSDATPNKMDEKNGSRKSNRRPSASVKEKENAILAAN